jgi:predicted acyl esterase
MKAHFSIVLIFLFIFGNSQTQQPETFVKDNFTKKEFYIPMRDGTKLFTAVYIPKDISNKNKYPFLMQRTCYSIAPYGENEYRTNSARILI